MKACATGGLVLLLLALLTLAQPGYRFLEIYSPQKTPTSQPTADVALLKNISAPTGAGR